MPVGDGNFRDLQVQTVVVYYEAARAELLERLNIRANLSVLYIAAIGTVAGYVVGDLVERWYLVIVIPLLAWGAATLWFQQNQMMDVLSEYCAQELCPDIEALWKDRVEARKPPRSIDQKLFPPPEKKEDTVIKELFGDVTEVTSILFVIPQLLSLIVICNFWREMWGGGDGRLTSLVPEWVIPFLVLGWAFLFLALTIREIIKDRKRRAERSRRTSASSPEAAPSSKATHKSVQHNQITFNMAAELGAQLRGKPCTAYVSDLRVKVAATGLHAYPDVVALCGEAIFDDSVMDTLLNPEVIIEVLSESTEAYDRGEKFAHYRRLPTLTDYVLIAQDKLRVEHYVRQDRQWVLSEADDWNDIIHLSSIGCRLALRDIYDKVNFPQEDTAAAAAVHGTPMVNAPDRPGA